MQRKASWGAVWGRPGALNLGFLCWLGCGSLLQGLGLRAREEEEASAVCTHHLSCTGREDNNYWERLKKKSLSNNYSLQKLEGGKENAGRIAAGSRGCWSRAALRCAAVADLEGETSAKHLCEAHL